MEAQWWRRYSSYSFTTSTLQGVSGQRHTPAALYPRGKDPRYPLYRRLVGPRAGLDTEVTGKILCPCRGSNVDLPLFISVARHYTEISRISYFIIIIISNSTVFVRTLPASHQRSLYLVKTLGRTPLDERSARRKGLYLHNIETQTSISRAGFEPTIPLTKRPRPIP
jgi:hypothetical protein